MLLMLADFQGKYGNTFGTTGFIAADGHCHGRGGVGGVVLGG